MNYKMCVSFGIDLVFLQRHLRYRLLSACFYIKLLRSFFFVLKFTTLSYWL